MPLGCPRKGYRTVFTRDFGKMSGSRGPTTKQASYSSTDQGAGKRRGCAIHSYYQCGCAEHFSQARIMRGQLLAIRAALALVLVAAPRKAARLHTRPVGR